MGKIFLVALTLGMGLFSFEKAQARDCTYEVYTRNAVYQNTISRAEGCQEAREACFRYADTYNPYGFCYDTRRDTTFDVRTRRELGPGHPSYYTGHGPGPGYPGPGPGHPGPGPGHPGPGPGYPGPGPGHPGPGPGLCLVDLYVRGNFQNTFRARNCVVALNECDNYAQYNFPHAWRRGHTACYRR